MSLPGPSDIQAFEYIRGDRLDEMDSSLDAWEGFVDDWINTHPSLREPNHLPAHVATLNGLLSDLVAVETQLPITFFRRHRSRINNMLRLLHRLQSNLATLLSDEEYLPPGKQWVMGPKRHPEIDIDLTELQRLWELGFTDKDMGELLQVSVPTIKRRRKRFDLGKRDWDRLSAEDLQEACLRVLHMGSGQQGYRFVWAALEVDGIRVQRDRVEAAMLSIWGPHDMHARSRSTAVRRVYSVGWANALWHMDGHHKLIRWRLVIHAAIDGFSRAITFVHCSNNNRADTVGQQFLTATHSFAWPDRIRVDYGKENLELKRLMEARPNRQERCFIQGKSTANQRIERLWVDLQVRCTNRFKRIFIELETQGHLHPDLPVDLWCLHFCFHDLINIYLKQFALTWNGHRVRTEKGNSPYQMYHRCVRQMERIDPVTTQQRADDMAVHRRLNFDLYGMDRFNRRAEDQPLDSDPYVDVKPPVHDCNPRTKQLLLYQPFLSNLLSRIGPVWPVPQDAGVSRYLLGRQLTYEYLAAYIDTPAEATTS